MNSNSKFEEIYKPYQSDRKSLNFLIVSDIHAGLEEIERLKEWIVENNAKFDLVVCPGDSACWSEGDSAEKEIEETKMVETVYSQLEHLGPPVYSIPGNHDPPLFHSSELTLNNTLNIQGQARKIEDKLYLVGFGGSGPAFQSEERLHSHYPFYSKNFTQIWPGFPFQGEFEEVEAGFKESFENTWNNLQIEPDSSVILVTHQGPFFSSTTLSIIDDTYIYTGSKTLWSFLFSDQNQVILNIHGHTHSSPGRNCLGPNYVVNPGSLKEGKFATLKVVQSYTGEWTVGETQFIDLTL